MIQFNKILIEFDTKIHNCPFNVKLGTEVNPNFRNLMKMFGFFRLGLEISFAVKLVQDFKSCYKILFKLFNLITASFCFGKLVKISENVSVLQSVLLINGTE